MDDLDFCVMYSSYNNYNMLENEVIPRSYLQKKLVINIDDFSTKEDMKKAEEICKNNQIVFIKNRNKGVQTAIQTTIDWLDKNNETKKWILLMQHDIFPINEEFYKNLNNTLRNKSLDKVGMLGFNVLDGEGEFTNNAFEQYLNGEKPNGYIGIPFLSDSKKEYKRVSKKLYFIFLILKFLNKTPFRNFKLIKKISNKYKASSNTRRNFCSKLFKDFDKVASKYPRLFSIELPCWAALAVNIDAWKECIIPCKELQFMLWAPDVAMQFLKNNYHCAVSKDLFLLNDQGCKEKYGFNRSSAEKKIVLENSKRQLDETNLYEEVFKKRWGFNYDNVKAEYSINSYKYKNTLVEKYFNHDSRKGPLKTFDNKNE